MSRFTHTLLGTALAVSLLGSGLVQAKISNEEAARLGQDLTPMGAEKAGNADGSIPAWTGKWRGLPPQTQIRRPRYAVPGPVRGGKTVVRDQLRRTWTSTPTTSPMARKRCSNATPTTFNIPVYPSHRDFRFDQRLEDLVKKNAVSAELANDNNDTQNAWGASPFPIPKNGSELMFNHTLAGRANTEEANYGQAVVYSNKERVLEEVNYKIFSIWSSPDKTLESANGILTNFLITTLEPVRKKGEIVVGHEFINPTASPRQAWQYSPGQRRVRRAPTVGYDSPSGAGGFRVYDEDRLFNGAPDRYNWTIVGKKEIYIPYHNYKIDDPSVSTDQILATTGHIDPQYMRYEKHRVWVLQATLKEGARHVYAKRVLYLDEDSWAATLADNYDSRGELWRTNMQTSIYAYELQRYHARLGIYHDLIAGSYLVDRMLIDQKPAKLNATAFTEDEFTPGNLRKLGTR